MKILVLGASGMLGNAVFKHFCRSAAYETHGSLRGGGAARYFPPGDAERLHTGIDATDPDALIRLLGHVRPDVVINAVGVIKQLASANDPLTVIPINTLLPHRLAILCSAVGARLIHVSTDCVFSGNKGGYVESDQPDATDLYGRSKLLGEVDYPNAVTLRTSIIGHELDSAHALVDWFLAQSGEVRGFTRAIFSGVPTVELARIIEHFVLPNPDMRGLYHVAACPISKHDLLQLVKRTYRKQISIVPDDQLSIDRSLSADRFNAATGYQPPDWETLIERMKEFK